MAYIAQPAHLRGRFRRRLFFRKTILDHVREGRTSNVKQHLWLELSIRPSALRNKSAKSNHGGLVLLVLIGAFLDPEPLTGGSFQNLFLLRRGRIWRQTELGFFPRQALRCLRERWGGAVGQDPTIRRRTKKGTKNNRAKNKAKERWEPLCGFTFTFRWRVFVPRNHHIGGSQHH